MISINNLKFLIFLINVFIIELESNGQSLKPEVVFHCLSTHNGLLSSEVYKVGYDSKGYLWICTDSGVSRFDGYYFKHFTEQEGLTDNCVFDFYEDSNGRIWFLTYNSLLCYFEKDTIYKIKQNKEINKYTKGANAFSKYLYIDKKGTLFYSIYTVGIFKIDIKSNEFVKIEQNQNILNSFSIDNELIPVFELNYSSLNNLKNDYPVLWGESSVKLKLKNQKLIPKVKYVSKKSFLAESDYLLLNNRIYNCQNGNIIYESDRIFDFIIDDDGNIWVGTKCGVHKLQVLNDKIIKIEKFLEKYSISCINYSELGGFWFSSLESGIFKSLDFDVSFLDENSGLLKNRIIDIGFLKNEVYVSYYNGWQNIDNCLVKHLDESIIFTKFMSIQNLLVISDQRPNVYKKEKRYFRIPYVGDICYKDKYIYTAEQRVKRINVLTGESLILYDYFLDTSNSKQANFNAIAIDDKNQVFLGNNNGLHLLKNGKLIRLIGLKNTFKVKDLLYDKNWGLVIGTKNNGVIIYNKGKISKWFNVKNGLSSNHVNSIFVTRNGTLLIGTNLGLNILRLHKSEIGLISKNQGLFNSEVTAINQYNDKIYVGTKLGLVILNESVFSLVKSNIKCKVYLEELLVNGKTQRLGNKNGIYSHDSRFFKIRFRTTYFDNWYSKLYQYRINEKEDWITITSPEILLNEPSENSYNIEIRYLDENNQWSMPYSLYSFKLNSPFWEKWYFLLIFTFVITFILFLIMRGIQKSKEMRLINQNQLYSIEQRMHSARMNPHFVFNVLNSIQSFLVFNENEKAEKYLLKFSNLMRKILQRTNDGSINLKDEIEFLVNYCEIESLRFGNNFDYEINYSSININCFLPTMLIQPFVENAIIHGISSNKKNRGCIKINISVYKEYVCFEIIDNGENENINIKEIISSKANHAVGLTIQRLECYNKMNKTNVFGLKISRLPGELPQTIFELRVPLIYSKNESTNC